jgi:hypothetical protein
MTCVSTFAFGVQLLIEGDRPRRHCKTVSIFDKFESSLPGPVFR